MIYKKREHTVSDYLQHDSYDKTDKYSIEEYGQNMVGKTFYDLTVLDDTVIFHESLADYNVSHENKKRKGGLDFFTTKQTVIRTLTLKKLV